MNQETYMLALVILASMLLYFGLYLIFGNIPNKLKGSVYQTARQYMGSAFLVIVLAVAIYFTFDLEEMHRKFKIALNISSYFIASKLFAASFFTIFGHHVKFKRGKLYLWRILDITFPLAVIASALLITDSRILPICSTIAAIILFVSIVVDIIYFFKRYRVFLSQGSLYYGKGITVRIDWMIKSVNFIILAGVLCGFFALLSSVLPKWILFAFISYFVGACIYIFNSFLRFVTTFSEMLDKSHGEESIPEIDITKTALTAESYRYINDKVCKWVEAKEYCESNITIIKTAAALGTNRLYLSHFINLTYRCSFRVWLSKLRIEEAKEILASDPLTKITVVAKRVGFTSLTSFTHAFKNMEAKSPSEWLREL